MTGFAEIVKDVKRNTSDCTEPDDALFAVGHFSSIDTILDRPMEEIIDRCNVMGFTRFEHERLKSEFKFR